MGYVCSISGAGKANKGNFKICINSFYKTLNVYIFVALYEEKIISICFWVFNIYFGS